jgi:type IV pilus assembly protein PilM
MPKPTTPIAGGREFLLYTFCSLFCCWNIETTMVNFFKGLLSRRKPGIGIELAPDRLNIAKIKKQGNRLQAQVYTEEVPEDSFADGQIADPPGMAELIDEVLSEHQIKDRQVATAIPVQGATIRSILVPAELDDESELRDFMNQEAGLYLPFPREEADLDYQKLIPIDGQPLVDEDGTEKVQVLLVATRKDITQTYIDTFTEAGLKIDVLEVSSFALLRTIREQLQQFTPNEAVIVTDIAFDSTEITIAVDGVPQFSRTIPIGGYHLNSAVLEAADLPPSRNLEKLQEMTIPANPTDIMGMSMGGTSPDTAAMLKVLQELSDELRRSIDFYLNQTDGLEVAQLLLAGPGSVVGQLDEYLMQRLSLPTSRIDPIETLSLDIDEDTMPLLQRPSMGVVLGLGLREV